jgi:hypothetical protein
VEQHLCWARAYDCDEVREGGSRPATTAGHGREAQAKVTRPALDRRTDPLLAQPLPPPNRWAKAGATCKLCCTFRCPSCLELLPVGWALAVK